MHKIFKIKIDAIAYGYYNPPAFAEWLLQQTQRFKGIMDSMPLTSGQHTVRQTFSKVIFLQSLLTICLLIPLALFNSWTAALSGLVGGGIAIIGSMAYVWVALINSDSADQVLRANFRAEMLKIVVTVLAFAAVMIFMQWVIVPWLFVAFFVASAGYWISLLVIK